MNWTYHRSAEGLASLNKAANRYFEALDCGRESVDYKSAIAGHLGDLMPLIIEYKSGRIADCFADAISGKHYAIAAFCIDPPIEILRSQSSDLDIDLALQLVDKNIPLKTVREIMLNLREGSLPDSASLRESLSRLVESSARTSPAMGNIIHNSLCTIFSGIIFNDSGVHEDDDLFFCESSLAHFLRYMPDTRKLFGGDLLRLASEDDLGDKAVLVASRLKVSSFEGIASLGNDFVESLGQAAAAGIDGRSSTFSSPALIGLIHSEHEIFKSITNALIQSAPPEGKSTLGLSETLLNATGHVYGYRRAGVRALCGALDCVDVSRLSTMVQTKGQYDLLVECGYNVSKLQRDQVGKDAAFAFVADDFNL